MEERSGCHCCSPLCRPVVVLIAALVTCPDDGCTMVAVATAADARRPCRLRRTTDMLPLLRPAGRPCVRACGRAGGRYLRRVSAQRCS